ncbi:MAG TPA: sigma 54-interacting transcriptional regulator [Spirochaetales bacterium]|nr:sigma 54-interacting transcriptional regulator [Spirochaetales bacterium]HRY55115.1 sigma 54-interacting transcriptional regulator [Spirochaetia bacterium]HRZ63876.1 sigma 54-interacting transcriptional regulator [Spirochaetia bacterium]
MRKKLVLVTFERDAMEHYLADLRSYFEDCIDIEGYCIKGELAEQIDCDLVLISNPSATRHVKPRLARDIEIIYLARTFARDGLDKVFGLPRGTRAMLVDYSYDTCMDMLSVFYEHGVKHLDFSPVYLEMPPAEIPDLDIAVTPGLLSYVPGRAREVIDVGWTVVDMSTMMELAIKLDIFDERLEERLIRYSAGTTPLSRSLLYALRSSLELRNQQGIVLDVIDDGVIVVDNQDNILQCNKRVYGMLKLSGRRLSGKFDRELLHESVGNRIIDEGKFENMLIKVSETSRSLLVTKRPILVEGHSYGHVYIVKDVTGLLDLEGHLRKQLREKGYVAKYGFADIGGGSEAMRDCVERAKRIAGIDATVLITGESGTGKELFAQSIHNASARAQKPFVAINCAALPPSLLESELFGYEDGAFTNAKKGGKKGLFEMAHTGTIFLDEIADVPLSVQAKLLRVLQEREVMRIGGSSIIPIDVRVIAATNQDLGELVERNVFRLDLFYRLNVVPLRLPALRERASDIPSLVESILASLGFGEKRLDEALLAELMAYPWKGNVRELINCVQYMAYLGEDTLSCRDLPPSFRGEGRSGIGALQAAAKAAREGPAAELQPWELEVAREILASLRSRSGGRRRLNAALRARGQETSETEVRRIMGLLRGWGYLEYGQGRSGARLTERGLAARL